MTGVEDDDNIGINETLHGNNKIGAKLNENVKADLRWLVVGQEYNDDIFGVDETFHDNNNVNT